GAVGLAQTRDEIRAADADRCRLADVHAVRRAVPALTDQSGESAKPTTQQIEHHAVALGHRAVVVVTRDGETRGGPQCDLAAVGKDDLGERVLLAHDDVAFLECGPAYREREM